MTPLEIFDRVCSHLLAQNQRAECDVGCAYRVNGLKCAVGCLITDEAYNPNMEGAGVWRLGAVGFEWREMEGEKSDLLARALNESGIPATLEIRNLLIELQSLHDTMPVAQWPERLADLRARLTSY